MKTTTQPLVFLVRWRQYPPGAPVPDCLDYGVVDALRSRGVVGLRAAEPVEAPAWRPDDKSMRPKAVRRKG
jgi:hypothetical protein